jgi:hypothetical protein
MATICEETFKSARSAQQEVMRRGTAIVHELVRDSSWEKNRLSCFDRSFFAGYDRPHFSFHDVERLIVPCVDVYRRSRRAAASVLEQRKRSACLRAGQMLLHEYASECEFWMVIH